MTSQGGAWGVPPIFFLLLGEGRAKIEGQHVVAEYRGRDRDRGDRGDGEMTEKVVYINRVSKVVKGGRRFSFSAVVVVGDGQGRVGAGMGKANEVPEAIRKGSAIARKSLIRVAMNQTTIAHPIVAHYGAAKVMMKPA